MWWNSWTVRRFGTSPQRIFETGSILTDHVAAAFRTHSCSVYRPCWNIAPVARTIRVRNTAHLESHFTVQDYVRGQFRMGVIRIARACRILPDEDTGESFARELFTKLVFVQKHHGDLPAQKRIALTGNCQWDR